MNTILYGKEYVQIYDGNIFLVFEMLINLKNFVINN